MASLFEIQRQMAVTARNMLKPFAISEVIYDERTRKHWFTIHHHGLDHRVEIETDDPR